MVLGPYVFPGWWAHSLYLSAVVEIHGFQRISWQDVRELTMKYLQGASLGGASRGACAGGVGDFLSQEKSVCISATVFLHQGLLRRKQVNLGTTGSSRGRLGTAEMGCTRDIARARQRRRAQTWPGLCWSLPCQKLVISNSQSVAEVMQCIPCRFFIIACVERPC